MIAKTLLGLKHDSQNSARFTYACERLTSGLIITLFRNSISNKQCQWRLMHWQIKRLTDSNIRRRYIT